MDGYAQQVPFNNMPSIHELSFQLAVQLCHREKRVAVKQRAFKRVKTSFDNYLDTGARSPMMLKLYANILRMESSSPIELRSQLESLLSLQPSQTFIYEYFGAVSYTLITL